MNEQHVKIIVAAIIEHEGKILMVRESEKKGGLWSPPQGKLDRGESITEAMIREVKEETGLCFKPVGVCLPIVVRRHSQRGVVSLKFFFTGPWKGELRAQNEIVEARFMTPNEIRKLRLKTPEIKKYLAHRHEVIVSSALQAFITDANNKNG